MVDLSFIGKEGIICSYEDVIAMVGYNVADQYRENGIISSDISDQQLISNYVNRNTYNFSEYLQKFGVNKDDADYISKDEVYYSSARALRPTNKFIYKIFEAAKVESVPYLAIYSKQYSSHIEKYIKGTFPFKIDYVHGDILPVIKNHINATIVTSDLDVINKCADIEEPTVLTVCDDFLYLSQMFSDGTETKIKKRNNIFLGYISCIKAGFIKY
jgi:hypothetical protein